MRIIKTSVLVIEPLHCPADYVAANCATCEFYCRPLAVTKGKRVKMEVVCAYEKEEE